LLKLASFGLPDDGRLSANLTIDDFEWLPASTLGPPGGRYLFRNRVPIPEPGKDPVWVYGFSTGGKITTLRGFHLALIRNLFLPYRVRDKEPEVDVEPK